MNERTPISRKGTEEVSLFCWTVFMIVWVRFCFILQFRFTPSGPCFNIRTFFPGMGISIIRRSPIPVSQFLYIETAPCQQVVSESVVVSCFLYYASEAYEVYAAVSGLVFVSWCQCFNLWFVGYFSGGFVWLHTVVILPAHTWRNNNIIITSGRRCDVVLA